MLDKVTRETFERIKGASFELTVSPGETIPLELTDVLGTGLQGGAKREQFAIHFRGPNTPALAQRIYRVFQADLGALDIFLVPIRSDATGMTYEAVFT